MCVAKQVLRRRPVRHEREPYSSIYSLLQLREGVVQRRAPPECGLPRRADDVVLEEVEDLLVVARVVRRPARRGGAVEDILQEAGEVARVLVPRAVLVVGPPRRPAPPPEIMALYAAAPSLAGDKAELYGKIKTACADLEETFSANPAELAAEAAYLCDVCKPKMDTLRAAVDAAEAEMDAALYPYPTYEALVYGHHF